MAPGCFYRSFRLLGRIIVSIFFRDIKVVGQENIPTDGAVIFCGNHANQFIDALMILSFARRDVQFLVAAKSTRKPIVGFFTRIFETIPVERPQDLAKPGSGRVVFVDETHLQGKDTRFTAQVKPGSVLYLPAPIPDQVVADVISDTELLLKAPGALSYNSGEDYSYKVAPKVDQSIVYEHAWRLLGQEGCVGIFPEGGSHDRTQMLPLKAGISIMALGALAQSKGLKLSIVACGLKYFKPHQFRSQVILQFGKPFEVKPEIVTQYQTEKRQACSALLQEIEFAMKHVTLSAPSYTELEAIYLARRIYLPMDEEENYSNIQINDLYKRFAKVYNKFRGREEMKDLVIELKGYSHELSILRIKDHEVREKKVSCCKFLFMFAVSFVRLSGCLLFAFMGILIMIPLGILLDYLAQVERQKALESSRVKLIGIDVMASKKVVAAIALYPIQSLCSTVLLYLILAWKFEVEWAGVYALVFFLVWPLYSYLCIRSIDGALSHYKTLRSRLISLIYSQKIEHLRRKREHLKRRIEMLVDEYGSQSQLNFKRIVQRNRLESEASETQSLFSVSYWTDLEINQAFNELGMLLGEEYE